MGRDDNICGHQQRAVDFYWAIRQCVMGCGVGLAVGSGGIGSPGCITTDKFNAGESPDITHYKDSNIIENIEILNIKSIKDFDLIVAKLRELLL